MEEKNNLFDENNQFNSQKSDISNESGINNNLNNYNNEENVVSNSLNEGIISNLESVNLQSSVNNNLENSVVNNNDSVQYEQINQNVNQSVSIEQPIYEEVKPQFAEVQIEKTKKELRTDSYFDGKLLELIGWNILNVLITIFTLGIGSAWGKCMLLRFEAEHTVLNGKRLKFVGNGGNLFVEQFKWFFLTIVTLGIYGFWVPIKRTKWVASYIHFEDEEYVRGESFFDGKLIQLIGVNILTFILNIISFGLLFTFTKCFKMKWYAKHMIINRKKVVFEGSAIGLLGKYLLWVFLTIITLGIYGLWLTIKMKKWEVKHTRLRLAGEEDAKDNLIVWLLVGAIFFALPFIIFITQVIPKIDWENIGSFGGAENTINDPYYDYNYNYQYDTVMQTRN